MDPYLDHEDPSFHSSFIRLESLVQAYMRYIQYETKHQRRNVRRKLTLRFLAALEEFLPLGVSKIQFDYITLTKTCYTLLNLIYSEIQENLQIQHLTYYNRHFGSQLPFGSRMVSEILQEAMEMHVGSRQKRELRGSPRFRVVSQVLESYLDAEASASSVPQ